MAVETTLGNRAYLLNLKRALEGQTAGTLEWVQVDAQQDDLWARVPYVRDRVALSGALRTRQALHRSERRGPVDAAMIHTQRLAHFSRGFMRRVPSVVSTDATPLTLDAYQRAIGKPPLHQGWRGALKRRIAAETFLAARKVVSFSEYTKGSLVTDYGIPEERVVVIPNGVDTRLWCPAPDRPKDGIFRMLFVGGDFVRKGGDLLLRWAKATRHRDWELHLVTGEPLQVAPPVHVHAGLTPNSPQLVALTQRCDLFVLPTRADMSPTAVMEALSTGLPVVVARTGGTAELVREGVDGHLIEPDSYQALSERLEDLLDRRSALATMAPRAREGAVARFDGGKNALRLMQVLEAAAAST
jgi:glycosyltransferase involved in cell wall biosynthesis